MQTGKLISGWIAVLAILPVAVAEKEDLVAPAKGQEKPPVEEAGEGTPLETLRALWKKIGPHAPEGSKLASDNKVVLETYYRSAARQLGELKKGEPPRNQELFALMCIPTPYGWPMSRSFRKDSK